MFDFDATLPFMALQFIVLAFVLNAIFYKPLNKVLDDRADYIRDNESQAKERLAKAKELASQYELQIAVAQKEAQQQKEAAAQEIEEQRQVALRSLEQQVDGLSRQILEKLLGPELVK